MDNFKRLRVRNLDMNQQMAAEYRTVWAGP